MRGQERSKMASRPFARTAQGKPSGKALWVKSKMARRPFPKRRFFAVGDETKAGMGRL
jgi:hypothetical protein